MSTATCEVLMNNYAMPMNDMPMNDMPMNGKDRMRHPFLPVLRRLLRPVARGFRTRAG